MDGMRLAAEKYVNANVERFGSLGSLLSALDMRETHEGWGDYLASDKDDYDWCGCTKSLADAIEQCRTGNPEDTSDILDNMREQLRLLDKLGVAEKGRMRDYFCGGSPNVTRAMMGLPRDMRQMHKAPQKVKHVEIVYDNSVSCGFDKGYVKEHGSKVLAIIQYLTDNGYSVKLSVVNSTDPHGLCGTNHDIGFTVCLKDYAEPLDIQKLSFPFANVAFFRRLGFRWIETCPMLEKPGFMSGYGRRADTMKHNFATLSDGNKAFHYIEISDIADMTVEEWLDENGFIR